MFEKCRNTEFFRNKLRKYSKIGGSGGLAPQNLKKNLKISLKSVKFRCISGKFGLLFYRAKKDPKNCQRAKSVTKNFSDPKIFPKSQI